MSCTQAALADTLYASFVLHCLAPGECSKPTCLCDFPMLLLSCVASYCIWFLVVFVTLLAAVAHAQSLL